MNTKTETMRLSVLIILLLFQVHVVFGQTSLKEINLNHGKFQVGFQHYTTTDSTRTYKRIYDYNNQILARPIPVSIWYPSNQNVTTTTPMRVLNYFEILKEEEEWEYLPNEQLLNWFYYSNTQANQDHLKEQTKAYSKIAFADGTFPVVVYAPSLEASSIENFALCEYLASNGYIVISSPSRGGETRWFSKNIQKNITTQARDIAFLIKEIAKFPTANMDQIATMAFSFGGLATMEAQMQNEHIKAMVSLDGTERYQYEILKKSHFFDKERLDVPYIHMAQKEIPEQVLKEDNIDADLNTTFKLYDSITNSKAYQLKFHHLTHYYFSTLGVLFQKRDSRQDKNDTEIMESYKWVSKYTLNFLNAFLKNEETALKFIENMPTANEIEKGLMTYSSKQAKNEAFNFQDFNELARKQDYENLYKLYESALLKYPSLALPEGNLNTLGLQLIFNLKTSEQGINVFLLATQLYPNSANIFDSLGEAYLFMDAKEKTIASFKKSLELNAQNQNAIDRLKELKE